MQFRLHFCNTWLQEAQINKQLNDKVNCVIISRHGLAVQQMMMDDDA
jgi:hypothetical protein